MPLIPNSKKRGYDSFLSFEMMIHPPLLPELAQPALMALDRSGSVGIPGQAVKLSQLIRVQPGAGAPLSTNRDQMWMSRQPRAPAAAGRAQQPNAPSSPHPSSPSRFHNGICKMGTTTGMG